MLVRTPPKPNHLDPPLGVGHSPRQGSELFENQLVIVLVVLGDLENKWFRLWFQFWFLVTVPFSFGDSILLFILLVVVLNGLVCQIFCKLFWFWAYYCY